MMGVEFWVAVGLPQNKIGFAMSTEKNYSLFRKKNVTFIRDVASHTKLKRTLGPWQLIAIGIGAIVGTGVFTFTGIAAQTAGPGVMLSFALAGLTCVFVALAYTEVAAAMPSSGGVYTYSYASLGEVIAWVVGWVAVLQFACGAMVVSMGWSGYVTGILNQVGFGLPEYLTSSFLDGGFFNLPAAVIIWIMSTILIKGTEESSIVNMVLVFVKLAIIMLFIFIAFPFFKVSNWHNFMPFGYEGIAIGAGTVFVSYTGFDAIANATEETHKPEKNVVIGLVGSVSVATILYMLVAGVLTGIVSFKLLNTPEPLARALKLNGSNMGGAIIACGAITGMTTVVLLQIYALTRVLMAMSRDGLVPKFFSKIHKKYATPHINTIVSGFIVSIGAGIFPIVVIGRLASIGTLVILVFVIINAIVLRRSKPNLHRPFRCPILPFVALLGFSFCSYLIFNLLSVVGTAFTLWLVLGLLVYFLYARKRANRVYINNH